MKNTKHRKFGGVSARDEMVILVSRPGVDLNMLSESMAAICTDGGSIVRAVKDGNGKANFPLSKLLPVLDSQPGVEMVFDNFELIDSKSLKPLILMLISDRLRSH